MQLVDSGEMKVLNDSDTIVLVASHLEPIYRELEPPYLEICAPKRNGLVQGYQHYAERYPGLEAHPESLSELIILLGAKPFFDNRKQVGLVHYRRIFSLKPDESNDQNYTQDLRNRYSCAGKSSEFLRSYTDKIVIPKSMALDTSMYEHFIFCHAPLERALDVACSAFNQSVKDIFGLIDSKSYLKNTQFIYPWNMWIGSPDFYNEWVAILLPVLKALDDISDSLPSEGFQSRWSGFISERLFTVYINLCRNTNRWNFVERPVILFEDVAVAERDVAVAERDVAVAERDVAVAERDNVVSRLERVLKSKSWTTTRFLRTGDKFLRRLFRSLKN
jgi:hypothetical protein